MNNVYHSPIVSIFTSRSNKKSSCEELIILLLVMITITVSLMRQFLIALIYQLNPNIWLTNYKIVNWNNALRKNK